MSSCSCLTVLPGPAWLLLNKLCKPLFRALYAYYASLCVNTVNVLSLLCISLLYLPLSLLLPLSLPFSNLQLHCSHGDYSNEVLLRTVLSLSLSPPAKWPFSQSVSQTLSPLSLSVASEIVVQVDRFQISVMQRRRRKKLRLTRVAARRWVTRVEALGSFEYHCLKIFFTICRARFFLFL